MIASDGLNRPLVSTKPYLANRGGRMQSEEIEGNVWRGVSFYIV